MMMENQTRQTKLYESKFHLLTNVGIFKISHAQNTFQSEN